MGKQSTTQGVAKPKNDLYTTPGDRGDASCNSGIGNIQSGYAGNLKGEASKGYESVNKGWGGNVKR